MEGMEVALNLKRGKRKRGINSEAFNPVVSTNTNKRKELQSMTSLPESVVLTPTQQGAVMLPEADR